MNDVYTLKIKYDNKVIFEGFKTNYFETTLFEFIQHCYLKYPKNKETEFYRILEENNLLKLFSIFEKETLKKQIETVSYNMPLLDSYEFISFESIPKFNKAFFNKVLLPHLSKLSTTKHKVTFTITKK